MSDGGLLTVEIAGLRLRRPVILAAGTAGTLDEMADAIDLSRVGAIVTKSITRESREGNPPWRILPERAGMLNAIGLANVGVERFCAEYAPRIASVPCPVIGSIAGNAIEDYRAVAEAFAKIDAMAAVELNVSCPNVHGGTEFGVDPVALAELVGEVRSALSGKRLFVKLSPIAVGRPSMVDVARAAADAGADALCISNTIPAMAIDIRTRKPKLANTTGGLSGPALHPVALRLVHTVYRELARERGLPIIGLGGVLRWEDAAAFILAGASAVEVGTGLFVDPRSPLKIAKGLEKWVRSQGERSIGGLVGSLRLQ
ncbi:MAG: dihydroorotate dehydrogenase [Phycisphaerales bacterium]|nr:MAG: dihydroorotate dehydrogenase [Phycisphaerales bacterium]